MSRYISRCKKCGIKEAIDLVGFVRLRYRRDWIDGMMREDQTQPYLAVDERAEINAIPESMRLCKCRRFRDIARVEGILVADVPCNAKCTGAFGPNCECSCGGKNHGAGHVIHRIEREVPVHYQKAVDDARAARLAAV